MIKVQAYCESSASAEDVIGPVLSDAHDPRSVNLALLFWDAFRGETPALALRSWNGAHSGPAGERFGLQYLLQAAQKYNLPLNLVDLQSPANLAALDFLGLWSEIKGLVDQGLLYFPATLPEDFQLAAHSPAITRTLLDDREAIRFAYGLESSVWLSIDSPQLSPADIELARQLGFQGLITIAGDWMDHKDPGLMTDFKGLLVLSRPRTDTETSEGYDHGLNLEWRKALLEHALTGTPAGSLVLGGSLPGTFWGDPVVADEALAWIAAHPWIEVVRLGELSRRVSPQPVMHLPSGLEPVTSSEPTVSGLILDDSELPRNYLDRMALDLYARASSMRICLPKTDPRWDDSWQTCDQPPANSLNRLREFALDDVGVLNYAARWARETACSPGGRPTRSDSVDLDQDGIIEAVLYNSSMLAVLDPAGGRVRMLFGCTPAYGVSMLIGPRSLEAIGLSDPSRWELDGNGIPETADPLLAGAVLSSPDARWTFNQRMTGQGILFQHPEGHLQILVSLLDNTLRMEYRSSRPDQTTAEISLLVAPERLEAPGFRGAYRIARQDSGVRIWVQPGPELRVGLPGPLWSSDSFLDSPAAERSAEDPNLELPLGHYLPFPFMLLRGPVQDGESITVTILP
jgi:hypothetical protein